MKQKVVFNPGKKSALTGLLSLAQKKEDFILLNNSYNSHFSQNFQYLAGIGKKKSLEEYNVAAIDAFLREASSSDETVFFHLTYPLKNKFEKLNDRFEDKYNWPLVHFFTAKVEIKVLNDEVIIQCNDGSNADDVWKAISEEVTQNNLTGNAVSCKPSLDRKTYNRKLKTILNHIQLGDIYEMNFCFPFEGDGEIDPYTVYELLCNSSPAPFSCFYKLKENFLLCSSPERFIQKTGSKIISQPIKGTAKRGSTIVEDEELKSDLYNNEKERSENVMIVDLVRNDLSRIAERGSVHVDELFGIYSFPSVHQMISTVSAAMRNDVSFTGILKALFPMGSMTGAPKIRAMEIINEQEEFNRGLYSGSVGYIKPNGDFDLNVVIRSILYNSVQKKISIPVGSAITAASDPDKEYDECLLKANALLSVLSKI